MSLVQKPAVPLARCILSNLRASSRGGLRQPVRTISACLINPSRQPRPSRSSNPPHHAPPPGRHLSTTPFLHKKGGNKDKGATTKLKDEAPEQYSRKGKPMNPVPGAEEAADDPYDFTKFDDSVKHAVERMKSEIQDLKAFSGRVDPSIVENVMVTISHGSGAAKAEMVAAGVAKEVKMRLSELAHVAPKGREFILTVNDEGFVNTIKNTLMAQLSLNPQPTSPSTPNILRVPMPMPTKEARTNTANLVQKAGQNGLDKLQNIRAAQVKHLKALQKDKKARPDDVKKAEKKMQDKLDATNKELKDMIEKAKQDVLQS